MARAVSLKPFRHILERERALPKEEQTVWTLRRLSASEREQVNDFQFSRAKEAKEVALRFNQDEVANAYLRIGLLGWENFLDENGVKLAFAPPVSGLCPKSNYDLIAPEDRYELADAIEKGNTLGESEIKN